MCKRAIEPRYGYWTLPAGFMENGETTEQAACRETMEEACARVLEPTLYQVFSIPHISQVHMYYRGTLEDRFAPGEESLEVRLFSAAEVPWNDIAFPTVRKTLKHYFEDLASGVFSFRDENIVPPGQHTDGRDTR
jgi:ADP-ribose pyrophosphatase YjhB (NUDIX family)